MLLPNLYDKDKESSWEWLVNTDLDSFWLCTLLCQRYIHNLDIFRWLNMQAKTQTEFCCKWIGLSIVQYISKIRPHDLCSLILIHTVRKRPCFRPCRFPRYLDTHRFLTSCSFSNRRYRASYSPQQPLVDEGIWVTLYEKGVKCVSLYDIGWRGGVVVKRWTINPEVRYQGPYSPTILWNVLCRILQIFLFLGALESNRKLYYIPICKSRRKRQRSSWEWSVKTKPDLTRRFLRHFVFSS